VIRGGETCPFSSRFATATASALAAHPLGPGHRRREPSLWLRMKPQSPSGLERNHPCPCPCPCPCLCSHLRLDSRAVKPMTLARVDETARDGVRPLGNRRTDARPRSGRSKSRPAQIHSMAMTTTSGSAAFPQEISLLSRLEQIADTDSLAFWGDGMSLFDRGGLDVSTVPRQTSL
jgi:hypothetical protein